MALALGCTVDELLNRISSSELTEWMAFYNIDPWGEQRADLRNGLLCSLTANLNRSKGSEPYKPLDFMPFYEKPKQSVVSKIKSFFYNGTK